MALIVPDGRPLLKITYRELSKGGKQKDSKWVVQIPWFNGAKHAVPKVEYQHGSYQVRFHFSDGSKITVNAKDQREGKRVIGRFLKCVIPSKIEGGTYAYSPPKEKIKGEANKLKESKLVPTTARYFPNGDGYVNGSPAQPDWVVDVQQSTT